MLKRGGQKGLRLAVMEVGRWASVPVEDVRLHEAAVFKEGEVLGTLERWEAVREHFAKFVREHPRSARLAEAVHEQARAAAKSGHAEKARELVRAVVKGLLLVKGGGSSWSGRCSRSSEIMPTV